jgi:hypothetical protein
MTGWTLAEGPVEYSPDNLYEYLNGGAERYESHGFLQLVHVRYQLGDDPYSCITLDLYDMGSKLGAFGIYSAGRPPRVETLKWGAEGYRQTTVARAYRDRFFVHAEADDSRPELLDMIDRLMSRVLAAAPGSTSPPAVLQALPAAGRIPSSERYVAHNLLGHSYLPRGVLARYELDGHTVELFFSDAGSETRAREAIEALRGFFSQHGSVSTESPAIGSGGFRHSDSMLGRGTVAYSGRFVVGVHGDAPMQAGERLLSRLVEALG